MSLTDPRAGALAAANGLAVQAAALPYILEELASMRDARMKYAFNELTKGTLTHEAAFTILMEVKSYNDLTRRLEMRVTRAQKEE